MKKLLTRCVFFLFLLTRLASLCAQNQDSLRMQLKQMPADSTRLVFLSQNLVGMAISSEDKYARSFLLLEEARKQKNVHYQGVAMLAVLQYFYIQSNMDSMAYWVEQSDPVFRQAGMYEELCRTRAWYIYGLTKAGANSVVLTEVKRLKELATTLPFPDGIDMANQALADFYFANSLKMEGVRLYEEVLHSMEERNVPLIKRINILRHLSRLHPEARERLKYLARLKQYTDEAEAAGVTHFDKETPVYYVKYIYHRGMIGANTELENSSKVLYHLNEIEKIVSDNRMDVDSELLSLWAMYYHKAGNYPQCLKVLDSLLFLSEQRKRYTDYLNALKAKSTVLYESGNYKTSRECLEQLLQMQDSVTQASYYKDLADMRAQHETDKLELKNKKMEMEAMRTHTQLIFLWSGLVVLAIICLLLGFSAYMIHRFGKQLKAAKEKAEEADRMKSAFLANMNHEIRTPLNAIVGFSQVLVDEDDRESRSQIAEIIQSNNELLQRLIEDVLDISKIESNSMTLRYAPVDLNILMKEIYSMILLRVPDCVELIYEDSQPLIMNTDRNRLTQVLTNLLNNAIKHTREGSICFGYQLMDKQICFFVRDTGGGIPEDKLDSIFSRFVKLDDWTKGVGLGLAICQGLVTKMNGSIRVESQIGKGSVFYVSLPLI